MEKRCYYIEIPLRILIFITWNALIYFCISFVLLEVDFRNWMEETRLIIPIFGIPLGLIFSAIPFEITRKKK